MAAPSQNFLKFAIAALLAGAALAALGLGIFAPEQKLRLAVPAWLTLVAGGTWYCVAKGRSSAAKYVLASGVWLAVTATALLSDGVRAPVVIAYPVIVLIAAWLIGARTALVLAALTLLSTLALSALEASGQLPHTWPSSLAMYVGDQLVVYLVSTLLAVYLVRAYRSREQALRESEERYRTAFQTSPDAVNINRLSDGLYLEVNEGFLRLTGWAREEIIGKTSADINIWHDPQDRQRLVQALRRDGVCENLEALFVTKDGRVVNALMSAHLMSVNAQPCILSVTRDMTQHQLAQAQINNLAFYDPLTQLPNRRLLLDRLEQTLSTSARHKRISAMLYVDLDNFKLLNETLGHDQGDLLLQQVASRLSACIREGDTAAHLGSDEFVVMLEDLSSNRIEAATQAEMVGGKILNALGGAYQLGEHWQHSTASIGVTLFDGSEQESRDEPLKRAELAMFQAKAAGHNTLRFFDAQMQVVVSARAALEAGLREALRQNQFVLYYQPQVTDAVRLTGVEALVRWLHPVRGLVAPAEFIALTEETGLILPLGQWVLEAACAQLALWAQQPTLAHLTVAVNVSARQFHLPDFVANVLATLAQTGANPMRLKLELTESLLVEDVEQVIAKMNALKAHGVGFSLDDFGTGYSSLSYLKRLPLDQLKIDQGFVKHILTDSNDAAIAKMVVALAGSLGLAVIAEGVELEAQKDFLADLGCHAYQGYLFSRPLPLAAFQAYAQQMAVLSNRQVRVDP